MRDPADDLIERLLDTVHYEGSSKHKRHPHLFGLEPFNGERDDATLCDEAVSAYSSWSNRSHTKGR